MNIHGHTHDSSFNDIVGSVKVFNPNPLFKGKYGIYSLRKLDDFWMLDSYEFLNN